jgi:hypothetical protein
MTLAQTCLTALLLLSPVSAWSQQAAGAPIQPAPFTSLEEGQWVRVTGDFGRGEGRVLGHTARDLTLSSEHQPLRLPATSVDTLWTRSRRTLAGALVGSLLGLGIGAVVAASSGELEDTPPEFIWGVAMGGGALVGGGLGALIGATTHDWKRQYPR